MALVAIPGTLPKSRGAAQLFACKTGRSQSIAFTCITAFAQAAP